MVLIVSKVQHAADFDRRRNGLRRRAYRDICTACRNQRHVVLLQLLIVDKSCKLRCHEKQIYSAIAHHNYHHLYLLHRGQSSHSS